jgi:hypothetical protein
MVGQAYKVLIFDDEKGLKKHFLLNETKPLEHCHMWLLSLAGSRVKSSAGMVGAGKGILISHAACFTTSCCGVSNVAR